MSIIYPRYKKIIKLPAGRFIFNKAIGFGAPFFGKIKPNVIELKPGYCEVQIKNRRGVQNHIGTINAGALCSLAELTGGMAIDTLVPDSMRWLPRGMTVKYLKKATGTVTAISQLETASVGVGDLDVLITVSNSDGEAVFTAVITFYVSAIEK